jgi:transposase InsO family protein
MPEGYGNTGRRPSLRARVQWSRLARRPSRSQVAGWLHRKRRLLPNGEAGSAVARGYFGSFIEAVYNRRRLHPALDYVSPEEYELTFPIARPLPDFRVSPEERSPGAVHQHSTCARGLTPDA